MSLIGRYIFREVLGSWLVVMLVLFAIFMTNQLADILGDAATNRLPRDAVLAIFGLTALRYFTLLMPISLFLGITLALARFNRDGEMAALASCGVGPGRLLVPIIGLTTLLAAGLAWLTFVSTPEASRRIEEIRHQAGRNVELAAIEPGRFTTQDGGDTVLYAREVAGDELRDVFVQTQRGERVVAILAERALRTTTPSGEQSFVLFDGRRYEGVPGESEFFVMGFDEHGMPVRREEEREFVELAAIKSTSALLASVALVDRAELHWRVSLPLSLFVLGVLAVPLSRASQREGRYARLGMALLVYIIYTNFLSIGRVWLERGVIDEGVGLWWVHGVVGLVALLMLARESGWFVRAAALRPVPS